MDRMVTAQSLRGYQKHSGFAMAVAGNVMDRGAVTGFTLGQGRFVVVADLVGLPGTGDLDGHDAQDEGDE